MQSEETLVNVNARIGRFIKSKSGLGADLSAGVRTVGVDALLIAETCRRCETFVDVLALQ